MEEKKEEPRIVYSGPIKVEMKLADVLEEFARRLVIARLRQAAQAQNEGDKQDG